MLEAFCIIFGSFLLCHRHGMKRNPLPATLRNNISCLSTTTEVKNLGGRKLHTAFPINPSNAEIIVYCVWGFRLVVIVHHCALLSETAHKYA